MKLWQKNYQLNKKIENYTVGNDSILDKELIGYDCIASKAHASVLLDAKILSTDEHQRLCKKLDEIIEKAGKNDFEILPSDEDCHTAIEKYLTQELGDTGKKIHTGRSRNDQVLTALRLYEKDKIKEVQTQITKLQKIFKTVQDNHKDVLLPGYTHMQKAMPSSVAMWLGSISDALGDDLEVLKALEKVIDKNPLGSAAGFGVPVLNLNREISTKELGFKKTLKNNLYCQNSRGKYESYIVSSLRQVMFSLNKLASDVMLFSMKEFQFIKLPKEFFTGSSIMPQKLNADAFEILRANYSIVLGEELKINSVISNLISGYNRDIQLTKEPVLKSFHLLLSSLEVVQIVFEKIEFDKAVIKKAMTEELFAVEEVNKLVASGIPFREAYQKVAKRFVE